MLTLTAPVSVKVEKGTPVELDACFERYFGEHEIEGVQCAGCDAKTTYISRSRFLTYPKVLWITLQRFMYDNWTAKKLEIELQVPHAEGTKLDL